MIFALYSELNDSNIGRNLGRPQYSYYFLLKSFRRVFEELGRIVLITDPESELHQLYARCQANREPCLFVSFTPPHLAPIRPQCPTICLFAWEFSTIPSSSWDQNPANNWCYVFSHHRGVVATSSYTARIVREALANYGTKVPVLSIPSPVWDDFESLRELDPLAHLETGSQISAPGCLQDSSEIPFDLRNLLPRQFGDTRIWSNLQAHRSPPHRTRNLRSRVRATGKLWRNWYREVFQGRLRHAPETKTPPSELPQSAPVKLDIAGIVFTTVLNPVDGRKCHVDLLTAFVWAFRDNPNATLVMKMSQSDADRYRHALNHLLHQLYPFKCRIIVFNGFLSDDEYRELILATTFYVNTSLCEGLCIPLMEFLSSGKLVIAPRHTAMEDYVNNEIAFVIESSKETNVWPHDPRGHYTTERYRNDWESIVRAYRESYTLATQRPEEYLQKSETAKSQMRKFCSFEAVTERMRSFIQDECEVTISQTRSRKAGESQAPSPA